MKKKTTTAESIRLISSQIAEKQMEINNEKNPNTRAELLNHLERLKIRKQVKELWLRYERIN